MNRPATAAVEAHGYRTLSMIGRGSQGAVYTVRHVAEGTTYVLKRMHIMEPEARRTALLEAETLQRLQHTAVIGYRDTFVDDEHLCLVMEYADSGDLASRISSARERPFGEEQVLQWFVQLALALHHVHERGVLHRDLKTQNVFVSAAAAHVKLGDFGIAKHLGTAPGEDALAETCVGTPYYMSPELFRGEAYGTKADVWALGCVLYELITRRRAFQAPNLNSLSVKVMRGDYGPVPPSYSSGLHDLVRSLLTVQADRRPSVGQILGSPFLRRHIVSYADEMLGGLSDAQILAQPALATLRSQLIYTCAIHPMSHRLPNGGAAAAPSSATSDDISPPSSARTDARVEGALRKLEDERRRRARDRDARRQRASRDAVAHRDAGGYRDATSHDHGGHRRTRLSYEGEGKGKGGGKGRPSDPGSEEFGARHVGMWASEEAPSGSSPPLLSPPLLPGPVQHLNYDWAGEAFHQSRAALHGRRKGHMRMGSDGSDSAGEAALEYREAALEYRLAEAGMRGPPLRSRDVSPPEDTQERLDRMIGDAMASMHRTSKDAFADAFDVSDTENASSVRNLNYGALSDRSEGAGNSEMEGGLGGLSAKDRVLAKKEMRKRQEEAAREGDLAAARQRYFQERVLADNAQRSQYLGSFVPYSDRPAQRLESCR